MSRRRGTSYVEVTIVCLVMVMATTRVLEVRDWGLDRTRDSVVKANLFAWNRALAQYLLANGGRPPPDLEALRPALVVERERDPYRWRGSRAGGRYALVRGVVRLVDDAGRPPAGRDTYGRAYADYR